MNRNRQILTVTMPIHCGLYPLWHWTGFQIYRSQLKPQSLNKIINVISPNRPTKLLAVDVITFNRNIETEHVRHGDGTLLFPGPDRHTSRIVGMTAAGPERLGRSMVETGAVGQTRATDLARIINCSSNQTLYSKYRSLKLTIQDTMITGNLQTAQFHNTQTSYCNTVLAASDAIIMNITGKHY